MKELVYTNRIYQTSPKPVSFLAKKFPALSFYPQFLMIVLKASVRAKRSRYDGIEWSQSSLGVLRALEKVGVYFEIAGIEYVEQLENPCVFIANHMSILETMILPAIIQPVKKVTFIVKQSLLDYPVFKHIMRSRDPIAVNRANPRKDLKAVLEGGVERLKNGISIVVFPQTTRTHSFDSVQFSTIGIKLAKKAQAPVVPIALLTDAWGNGKYIKDFGKIDPSKKVCFAFGKPAWVRSRGSEENKAIIQFISKKLQKWRDKE